jgi:hypothetical protein
MAERRELELNDLDGVLGELDRLQQRGYDEAGQWDLAQVCWHCALPLGEALDGFSFKPPLFVRLMVKVMGVKDKLFRTRKIKPGFKAPGPFVPPSDLDEQEQVAKLCQAIERFKAHNGAFLIHPVFGEFSAERWHQFVTIHTMHHLAFLLPKN